MTVFQTHYDNLKVSMNAPPEVIAAAYKALSRQFHPDLHPDNPYAERAMRIINTSYNVLSDPAKRRAHDEWIASKIVENIKSHSRPSAATAPMKNLPPSSRMRSMLSHLGRNLWTYLVLGMVGVGIWAANQPPSASGLPEYVAEPSDELANADPVTPDYIRADTAPNGNAWPSTAAYIKGYPIARADGLSKLTIDNSSNDTDVFVKLVALDTEQTLPIRHAYIPAYSSFTMNKIRAGNYDVRHMDLMDGSLSRSESFNLEEIRTADGVRFSVTTMTLYKVAQGNMQSYPLAADEF